MARAARTCESSKRARTCPFLTALPSSTKTSRTLPVTFDDTVARRRAVTYPDALRTAPGVAPPETAVTTVVFTVAACAPWLQNQPAAAPASTTMATAMSQPPRRFPPARAS